MPSSPLRPLTRLAALVAALALVPSVAAAETSRACPAFVVDHGRPIETACRALRLPTSPVHDFLKMAHAPARSTVRRLVTERQALQSELGPRPSLAVLLDALEFGRSGRLGVALPESIGRLRSQASGRLALALDRAVAINYLAYDQERKIAQIPHAAHPESVAFVLQEVLRRSGETTQDTQALGVILALLHDLIEDNVHLAVTHQEANSAVLQVIDRQAPPAELPRSERLIWSTAAARDALNEAFAGIEVPGAGGVGDAVVYLTEPPSPHGFAQYLHVPRMGAGAVGTRDLRQRMTRAAAFADLASRGGELVAGVKLADLLSNASRLHVPSRHHDLPGLPLRSRLLHDVAARSFFADRLAAQAGQLGALKPAFDDMITDVLNSDDLAAVLGRDRWCDACTLEQRMQLFAYDNRARISAHTEDYLAKLAALPSAARCAQKRR
ncbi:MAG: hypothetical protein IPL40_11100 [Proteobacteria bacterium]|nr:hypothetical protein [Pseudomonadota bacterium]